MRVALFSDVHGNGVAFRAMLADLREQDADRVVCLGDHAQGGPEPAECLELLRELGCPAVMGNSDHFLLTLDPGAEEFTEAQIENAKWAQSELSEDLLAFHRAFQPAIEIDVGAGRMLLPFTRRRARVTRSSAPGWKRGGSGGPSRGSRPQSSQAGTRTSSGRGGSARPTTSIPGASGSRSTTTSLRPRRMPRPRAEYAILAVDDHGVGIDFRRIPFDVDELIRSVETSGMPSPEDAAGPWRHLGTPT